MISELVARALAHSNKNSYYCYSYVGSLNDDHIVSNVENEQKVRFLIHLLEAVKFIHDKDIIHNNIIPANLLVTSRNTLVLSGYGAAVL